MTAALSGWPNAMPPPDRVDDEQVAALAGQLGPAVVEHVAVVVAGLGREADDAPGRRRRGRRPARPGCRGSDRARSGRGRRRAFLILSSAHVGRAEVGDRRGHHDHVGVVGRLEHRPRAAPRRCRPGRPRRRPGRAASTLAATSVTRRAAGGGDRGERVALPPGGAVAEEAHRVERLAGAAGGDDDVPAGQVGGQRVGRGAAAARRAAAISAGSGSRPLPVSAPVSRPIAGSSTIDAAAAQRGDVVDASPGAPTSRCASPARTAPGSARSAGCW